FRRARRAEEGDRAGARLPLAALLGALSARGVGPRAPRAAADPPPPAPPPREQQPMLAALIRPLFNAGSGQQARELVGDALDRLRTPLPKVAALLEEAEEDLLAFYAFPADHWQKLRSTNPLERVNRTPHPRHRSANSG